MKEEVYMLNLMWLYAIIIILMLFIEIWLLNFWAKEHALLMQIMSQRLIEIKKYLQEKDKF